MLDYFFARFVDNGLVATRLWDQLICVLILILLSNDIVYFNDVFLLFDVFIAMVCIHLLDTVL